MFDRNFNFTRRNHMRICDRRSGLHDHLHGVARKESEKLRKENDEKAGGNEMNAEPFVVDLDLLEDCVRIYGKRSQVDMAIEEMSELTKALLKERRIPDGKACADHIAEEMADVTIMLMQLQMIFDNSEEIQEQITYKLERQRKRLKCLVDSEFSGKEPNPQALPESMYQEAVDNK